MKSDLFVKNPQIMYDIDPTQWQLFQLPTTQPPICDETKPYVVVAVSLTSLNSPITANEVNTAVSRSKARKALWAQII